jgi:hypothetical protein
LACGGKIGKHDFHKRSQDEDEGLRAWVIRLFGELPKRTVNANHGTAAIEMGRPSESLYEDF